MFRVGNKNQYLSVGCFAAFLTGVVVVTSSFLARGLAERKSIHSNSWFMESYSRSYNQIHILFTIVFTKAILFVTSCEAAGHGLA